VEQLNKQFKLFTTQNFFQCADEHEKRHLAFQSSNEAHIVLHNFHY